MKQTDVTPFSCGSWPQARTQQSSKILTCGPYVAELRTKAAEVREFEEW
jgi:hypothetical protein